MATWPTDPASTSDLAQNKALLPKRTRGLRNMLACFLETPFSASDADDSTNSGSWTLIHSLSLRLQQFGIYNRLACMFSMKVDSGVTAQWCLSWGGGVYGDPVTVTSTSYAFSGPGYINGAEDLNNDSPKQVHTALLVYGKITAGTGSLYITTTNYDPVLWVTE